MQAGGSLALVCLGSSRATPPTRAIRPLPSFFFCQPLAGASVTQQLLPLSRTRMDVYRVLYVL